MTLATSHDGFTIDDHVYRRRWWTLAVLCTSLVIVIVGNTSLNVALPTLARELDASSTQLQWMVDAYALVFAGFLFTAGALGDRYGRKGALQIGLLIFLGGCLLAAFLETAEGVILGRAVMGLGAAFVMPSTLSVLANVFPPQERTKAIAIWAGISGAGAALGPIASGFLLEHFSWGAVFFVNVPIILVALVAGWFLVPRSSDPEHARLDPVGALLSIAGLSALVYSIIEAPHHGWASLTTFAWFTAALVLIGSLHRLGAAQQAPHARPALVPRPPLQRGQRRHHAGVLRHVRHVLPDHPVLPAGAGLLRARGRYQAAAGRRHDGPGGSRRRPASRPASAPTG